MNRIIISKWKASDFSLRENRNEDIVHLIE
nr:MAG TPA: hypothetical protein [Caudoviricetes sp.]DAP10459.1 MAG TPA: hypothetical protein [Caudoviricetes sp.]